MSKRNINHKSGKQLYLNQIFQRGMLYTSSEMQEGYAKIIDNYDIAPTGDAASPRSPFNVPTMNLNLDYKYISPVKFKQLMGNQSYIRFKRTITEEDFVEDKIESPLENPGKTIDVVYRNDNAFNEGSLTLEQLDYSYAVNEGSDDSDIEEDPEIEELGNIVKVDLNSDVNGNLSFEICEDSDRSESEKNSNINISLTGNNIVLSDLEQVFTDEDKQYHKKCTFDLNNSVINTCISDIKNLPDWTLSIKLQLDPMVFFTDRLRYKSTGSFAVPGDTIGVIGTFDSSSYSSFRKKLNDRFTNYLIRNDEYRYSYYANLSTILSSNLAYKMYLNIIDSDKKEYILNQSLSIKSFEYKFKFFNELRHIGQGNFEKQLNDINLRDWFLNKSDTYVNAIDDPVLYPNTSVDIKHYDGFDKPTNPSDGLEIMSYMEIGVEENNYPLPFDIYRDDNNKRSYLKFPYNILRRSAYTLEEGDPGYEDSLATISDTSFLEDNISLAHFINEKNGKFGDEDDAFKDENFKTNKHLFEIEVILKGSSYNDVLSKFSTWVTQNQNTININNTSSAFHFFTQVLCSNVSVEVYNTFFNKKCSFTELLLEYLNRNENLIQHYKEKDETSYNQYLNNLADENISISYRSSNVIDDLSPCDDEDTEIYNTQESLKTTTTSHLTDTYYKQDNTVSYSVEDGDTFTYKQNSTSPSKTYRLWIADSVEKRFKWYIYSKNFLESLLNTISNYGTTNDTYLKIEYKSTSYGRDVANFNIITHPSDLNNFIEIKDLKDVYYVEDLSNVQELPDFNLTYPAFIEYQNSPTNVNLKNSCRIYYDTQIYQAVNNNIVLEYSKYSTFSLTPIIQEHYLLELFLKSGLYTIRSGISSIENAFLWSAEAERNGYYRYWDETKFPNLMFTDPYYNPSDIVVEVDYTDDSLQITEDMYIEAVKLQNEHYISALTKTSLDYVNTIYIDYLDAIGFIGRIINYKTNSIVYKGLITIKPDINTEGNLYFRISLPRAQGEGYQPNVIESSSNGYNLYNEELFHVENTSNKYEPFLIQGLAVLKTNFEDDIPTINYDKPSLVTHGVVGQTVGLNALLNEGYWINTGLHNTDKWGYRINLRIKANYIKGSEIAGSRAITFDITKPISNTSNVYYKNIDLTSSDYESTIEYDSIIFDSIIITDISLITPENETVAISREGKRLFIIVDETKSYEVVDLVSSDEGFFELKLKIAFNPSYDYATFSVYDNFNSPSKTLSSNDETQTIELIDRESAPQVVREFYSQWSVADYNSNVYEPLQDEVLIYKSEGSSLTKMANVSEDLLWTINRIGNLTFKFSIKPKIRISDDPNHPLYNYFMTNSFEEQYQVYPKFEVDNNLEFISTEDITKNINIKNATKLDIFNRQIVLYGDYIGSNILQFSNFEEFDYYPFPYNTIELPEPIVYVKNYKDALIIFGKTSIYMLSGAASIRECTLNKIYENLSCRLPDIKNIQPIGNNLMFFNNGMGYIIVPNTYVDSSSNIKIYKLTEYISNFFYNPEEYIRLRLEEKNISVNDSLTYTISFDSYVENNTINVIANIEVYDSTTSQKYYLPTIFIYNQDYKYWKMYSTDIFDEITAKYVCEPNLNTQFIVRKGDKYYLSYLSNTTQTTQDVFENTKKSIETILHSGYLSVDTMNDKRFKDIIIEFDKINPEDKLQINFEFFVDSSPIILSSENILVIDKLGNSLNNLGTEKILTEFINYSAQHISNNETPNTTYSHKYGTLFEIDNRKFSITGRTHIRIPVFGKGRLPSFILKIKANKFYEFINYALIYKEKNINRRA